MSQQELQAQHKREVEKKQESTMPVRDFVPVTDIFETEQALTVVLEMPGVSKESVEVGVENDVLTDHRPYRLVEIRGASAALHRIQHRQL